MATFAVICEGVSENNALHAIIDKYCEDAYISDIQPKINNAGNHPAQASPGGWTEVLSHCNTDTFQEALQQNDYLVVQIDTDKCNEFDVSTTDDQGNPRDPKDVYDDIVARLLRDIDPILIAEKKDHIIFAICFNEIECWFLPLFYNNKSQCATHNCIYLLNNELVKKDPSYSIPKKQKNNDQARKTYQYIFKQLKRKNIPNIAQHNYGFSEFIKSLDTIK